MHAVRTTGTRTGQSINEKRLMLMLAHKTERFTTEAVSEAGLNIVSTEEF